MKILNSKKRVVALALAAVAATGATAVQAGAISPTIPLRGSGTVCLTPEAARALATQGVKFEAIAPATAAGTCVRLPGTGTLAPDLTGGELPLQGGMRFSSSGHRLDLTDVRVHIHIVEGNTTADASQNGAPARNIELVRFPVSLSRVSFTPTTVDTRNVPLNLTAPGAAAFTSAFGTSPVAVGTPLFTFDGHGEITNPLSGPALP